MTQMKTLTIGGETFEIVDEKARNDIESIKNNSSQVTLRSPDGTAWLISVSNDGVITAVKQSNDNPDVPTVIETYTVFVPQNVSDEWKVTDGNGTLSMSDTEFLELFYDGFVSTPPSGVTVTKSSMGKDESGQYDMFEYDFCPTNYSRTILLSSGMHTYELSASFGLANFIGHLYTDVGNDAFDYIRNNVRIKVIPIVNPWGFNQYPKTYGNMNGVNPNRNFDLNGEWAAFPDYTPSQNEWNVKGAYPFSEAEARNLARWAESNWNAEFWIDCHTGEGYSDKDLWVYYSSDSAILDRINGGISKIEAWFKETYGEDCVTTRTIDSEGSIRLRWADEIAGIEGMILEQAPKRTTFGTSATNEAADISNYSTNISTFVQELLLEAYRDETVVNIESVSASDITITSDELSKTVEAAIEPTNTTQNHFKWESSDPSIIDVYGGTNKAVLVNKGTGSATITLTNRYNPSIKTSFEVTSDGSSMPQYVQGYITSVGATNAGDGTFYTSANFIDATGYNGVNIVLPDSVEIVTRIMVAEYDENGEFIQRQASEVVASGIYEYTCSLHALTKKIKYCVQWLQADTIDTFKLNTVFDSAYSVVSYFSDSDNPKIGAGLRTIDSVTGRISSTSSSNRILTDMIPVTSGEISVEVPPTFYVKAFVYDEVETYLVEDSYTSNFAGSNFDSCAFSANVPNGYVRLLIKKADNSDITEGEMLATWVKVNGAIFYMESSVENPNNTIAAGIRGVTSADGSIVENTARILTDIIPLYSHQGFVVKSDNGYYVKLFFYNADGTYNGTSLGDLVTDSADSTTKTSFWGKSLYARILLKKPDGSDFTAEEFGAATISIGSHTYHLIQTEE